MTTIEQLHARVFAALNHYKSLARAEEGHTLDKAVVTTASGALQEAAATACEIRFFEVLAPAAAREQKRDRLRKRCAAMSTKSIPSSDLHPTLWSKVQAWIQ